MTAGSSQVEDTNLPPFLDRDRVDAVRVRTIWLYLGFAPAMSDTTRPTALLHHHTLVCKRYAVCQHNCFTEWWKRSAYGRWPEPERANNRPVDRGRKHVCFYLGNPIRFPAEYCKRISNSSTTTGYSGLLQCNSNAANELCSWRPIYG